MVSVWCPTFAPTNNPTAGSTTIVGKETLKEYMGTCGENEKLKKLFTEDGYHTVVLNPQKGSAGGWAPYVNRPDASGIAEGSILTVVVESNWEVYVQWEDGDDNICKNLVDGHEISFKIEDNEWVLEKSEGSDECPDIQRGNGDNEYVQRACDSTDSPTAGPTASPTVSPTDSPTDAPTASPTIEPTDSPTDSPTDAPTASPTADPTASPTFAPTNTP